MRARYPLQYRERFLLSLASRNYTIESCARSALGVVHAMQLPRMLRTMKPIKAVAVYAAAVTVLALTLFNPKHSNGSTSTSNASFHDTAIEQPLFLADENNHKSVSNGWANAKSAAAANTNANAAYAPASNTNNRARAYTSNSVSSIYTRAQPGAGTGIADAMESDSGALFPISGQHSTSATGENPTTLEIDEAALAPASPTPAPATQWDLELAFDMGAPNDRICRIRSACLASDGTIVMKQVMRKHQTLLRSCGVNKFKYVEALPRLTRHDLIGHVPMRWHMPHFATDLLPTLYAREVLRPTFTKLKTLKTTSRSCFIRNRKARGNECGFEPFMIALYADKRVETLSPSAWVHELLRLYPWYPHISYEPKRGKLACYKSIVAYPRLSVGRNWRGWYGSRNPLYEKHNIRRDSVIVKPEGDDPGTCTINIKVINRNGWAMKGDYQVGRDIINIPEVRREIEKAAERRKLDINFDVVQFETRDFKQQIEAVQDAHVILGAHGAGLANLIFARMDASLIEVFPFGYKPIAYRRLALAMHMKYNQIMAKPDEKYVPQCVTQAAKSNNLDIVKTSGIKTWRVAVDSWKAARKLILKAEDFKGDKPTFLIKNCIRSQRMYLQPRETAKIVIDEAERICNARKLPPPKPIYPNPV